MSVMEKFIFCLVWSIIAIVFWLLTGCVSKTINKNCVSTSDDKYFVCDQVWVK